jgi:hypothetical protein
LVTSYYAAHAWRLAGELSELPPISDYGKLAINGNNEHAWRVWNTMADCLARAYLTLDLMRDPASDWVGRLGHYTFSDPDEVQRVATRHLLADVIARRGDPALVLKAME